MSKIILLHGFAVGLSSPFLRPDFGSSTSMSAFDDLISNNDAVVFPWGINCRVSWFQLINPVLIYRLYQDEFDLINSDALQSELEKFIENEKPTIIVCHSMGCSLLQKYLKKNKPLSSVKYIVLIQSDLDAKISFQTNIPIYNLFCPWDPTLLLSSIANQSIRAGLYKSKQPKIKNIFFPLLLPWNLHTSSIRDKKLIKFIYSIL